MQHRTAVLKYTIYDWDGIEWSDILQTQIRFSGLHYSCIFILFLNKMTVIIDQGDSFYFSISDVIYEVDKS